MAVYYFLASIPAFRAHPPRGGGAFPRSRRLASPFVGVVAALLLIVGLRLAQERQGRAYGWVAAILGAASVGLAIHAGMRRRK